MDWGIEATVLFAFMAFLWQKNDYASFSILEISEEK